MNTNLRNAAIARRLIITPLEIPGISSSHKIDEEFTILLFNDLWILQLAFFSTTIPVLHQMRLKNHSKLLLGMASLVLGAVFLDSRHDSSNAMLLGVSKL